MSKRKIGILLLLCSACAFNTYGGCKKSKKDQVAAAPVAAQTADSSASKYDYILIERVGGGDKLFSLSANGTDSMDAEFARYRFRDTSFAFNIGKPELADSLFTILNDILSGKQGIIKEETSYSAGGFVMGSWLKCQAVKDTVKTLITDERAKNAMTEIERHLDSKIESKK